MGQSPPRLCHASLFMGDCSIHTYQAAYSSDNPAHLFSLLLSMVELPYVLSNALVCSIPMPQPAGSLAYRVFVSERLR